MTFFLTRTLIILQNFVTQKWRMHGNNHFFFNFIFFYFFNLINFFINSLGYIFCSIQQFPIYVEAFQPFFKCYSCPVLVLYTQNQPIQWSVFPKHAVDYVFFFYRGITQKVSLNYFFIFYQFYFLFLGHKTSHKSKRSSLWRELAKLVSWQKMCIK